MTKRIEGVGLSSFGFLVVLISLILGFGEKEKKNRSENQSCFALRMSNRIELKAKLKRKSNNNVALSTFSGISRQQRRQRHFFVVRMNLNKAKHCVRLNSILRKSQVHFRSFAHFSTVMKLSIFLCMNVLD